MIAKGTIKGSLPGSVPFLAFEVLKKAAAPLSSSAIFSRLDPALNIRRISLNTALNQLAKSKIIEKAGTRQTMTFSYYGVELPIRIPVPRYWDLKRRPLEGQAAATTQKPNAKTIKPFWNDPRASLSQSHFPKPFRVDAAVRINCNTCEWWGPQSGCTECTYELPRRDKAA